MWAFKIRITKNVFFCFLLQIQNWKGVQGIAQSWKTSGILSKSGPNDDLEQLTSFLHQCLHALDEKSLTWFLPHWPWVRSFKVTDFTNIVIWASMLYMFSTDSFSIHHLLTFWIGKGHVNLTGSGEQAVTKMCQYCLIAVVVQHSSEANCHFGCLALVKENNCLLA